jgi:uncharacterized protein YPO0396
VTDDFTLEDAQAALDNSPYHAIRILRARLAEVEAERSRLQELTQVAFEERNAFERRAEAAEAERDRLIEVLRADPSGAIPALAGAALRLKAAEAALARVEALCDQWDDLPNHVRRDIDAFDVICEVRAAIRGPEVDRGE